MLELLCKIVNTPFFETYKEHKLDKYYTINNVKSIFLKIKNENNTISYNGSTRRFNNIGVIDLNGVRYYDLDDDMWTMTNKGLQCYATL